FLPFDRTIKAACISGDGKRAAFCGPWRKDAICEHAIYVWSIDNDSLTTVINEWIEFESIATDLEGRRLIASSRDGRLLVLDGHLFGSRREIRVPWRDGCRRLALSPDGKWLAAGSLSYDGIVLWDLDRVPDMR